MHKSPWDRIAVFFDSYYKRFTPRFSEEREQEAKVEQEAIARLWDNPDLTWEELIKKHKHDNQNIVQTFYYHLSRKYKDSPLIVKNTWEQNLQKFVQLIDHSNDQHQDLNKKEELSKIIDKFYWNRSQTFLVVNQFVFYLEPQAASIITNSLGYQEILKCGNYYKIQKLGRELQNFLEITPGKIKEQVAKNLVEKLGETEANFSYELNLLKEENQFLKDEIELIKTTANQEANYELAKSLENQLVLTQILTLKQKLDKALAEKQPLSTRDTLTFSIVLENILKALKSLDIIPFPANVNLEFTITEEQLGEYNYTQGTPFDTNQDSKQVRCTRQGWKIGDARRACASAHRIITSANVEEIINPSE